LSFADVLAVRVGNGNGALARYSVTNVRRRSADAQNRAATSNPLVDVHRLVAVGEMVDPRDLISAAEVQAILKLSHPSSVTTYLKRYDDFPQPVVDLSGSRVRLWRRQDILRWRDARGARP
jgi:predicted DNA-binding transcriptional regulator AlpA